MKVFITGSVGFIRSAQALCLPGPGDSDIDNQYDSAIKEAPLARHANYPRYIDLRIDLTDRRAIEDAFSNYRLRRQGGLAAQNGVCYSIANAFACRCSHA